VQHGGAGFSMIQVANLSACIQECIKKEFPPCRGFTFLKTDRQCWMKTKMVERTPNKPDYVSGFCEEFDEYGRPPLNVAFTMKTIGDRLGALCQSTMSTDGWAAQWSIRDLKKFRDRKGDALWFCPAKVSCSLYSSPSEAEEPYQALPQLRSEAQPTHTKTYVCESDAFAYNLTIYDKKLSCSDNMTKHKNVEKIDLICNWSGWSLGKFYFDFKIMGVYSPDSEITTRLNLDNGQFGKKIACNYLGFEGVEARATSTCLVNDAALYIRQLNDHEIPKVYCDKQSSSSSFGIRYLERNCALDQNPLAYQRDITLEPNNTEIVWRLRAEFRQNFTIRVPRSVFAEDSHYAVAIKVNGVFVGVENDPGWSAWFYLPSSACIGSPAIVIIAVCGSLHSIFAI